MPRTPASIHAKFDHVIAPVGKEPMIDPRTPVSMEAQAIVKAMRRGGAITAFRCRTVAVEGPRSCAIE